MSYTTKFLYYETIDIFGALKGVKSINYNKNYYNKTGYVRHEETTNGYVIISAEAETDIPNRHVLDRFRESVIDYFRTKNHRNPRTAVREAINHAQRQLYFYGQHDDRSLGKTLSCLVVLIHEKLVYYAYVGNNNLFFKTGKGVQRLTTGVSMVENDELDEIPLVNSSILNLDLDIKVCTEPLNPDTDDCLLVCTREFVKTSDEEVDKILAEGSDIQQKAGGMLRFLIQDMLAVDQAEPMSFTLVRFHLQSGQGQVVDSSSFLYAGILNKLFAIAISVKTLLILLLVLIGLVLYLFLQNDSPDDTPEQEFSNMESVG